MRADTTGAQSNSIDLQASWCNVRFRRKSLVGTRQYAQCPIAGAVGLTPPRRRARWAPTVTMLSRGWPMPPASLASEGPRPARLGGAARPTACQAAPR